MTDKSDIEIEIIEINGTGFRITNDPWTGDWLVDSPDELVQANYFMTKRGAINWCLDRCGVLSNSDYQFAPDRTSA
jgi:hypothetical protein